MIPTRAGGVLRQYLQQLADVCDLCVCDLVRVGRLVVRLGALAGADCEHSDLLRTGDVFLSTITA